MSWLDPFAQAKRQAALVIGTGALVILLGLLGWALRLDHLRAHWKDRFDALGRQAGTVLVALREASDNPDVRWDDAPLQIAALGASNRNLKEAIAIQNDRVDRMAAEAVRLRARADELHAIAERAQAQRKAALARLSDMAITPGTRADCETLLREAEDALDLVREAGL